MRLNLVPKFTKKITISDIKQYLVDEFENSNNKQREIDNLKDKLKKAVETEIKYQTTLVTLDEYKKRLEEKEKRINRLDKDIEHLENKLRKENELKNNEILKYKKLSGEYTKIKNSFDEEIDKKINFIKSTLNKEHHLEILKIKKEKEEFITTFIMDKINSIKDIKGTLSKTKVISILENTNEKTRTT